MLLKTKKKKNDYMSQTVYTWINIKYNLLYVNNCQLKTIKCCKNIAIAYIFKVTKICFYKTPKFYDKKL